MDVRLVAPRRAALLTLLALSMAAVGLAAAGAPASAGNPSRVAGAPVVFVHGFLLNSCPGTNPNSTFAGAVGALKSRGYAGANDLIDYYACDSKGSDIQASGDPKAYFASGAYVGGGGNTDNTDLRHIAYQLAWYLYDTYSSHGRPVEVVAHSMGGLIVRWALYQVQAHNPLFPKVLYVQDVVTISTPHDGTRDAYNNVSWCPSSLQCSQMLPGSAFLTELHASGMNPQGTGGTDWTVMGGSPCDIMTAGQATDVGDVHKVIYFSKTPVCYKHTSYLTDASAALDVPVQIRGPGDAALRTTTGAHSLRWMVDALTSANS